MPFINCVVVHNDVNRLKESDAVLTICLKF